MLRAQLWCSSWKGEGTIHKRGEREACAGGDTHKEVTGGENGHHQRHNVAQCQPAIRTPCTLPASHAHAAMHGTQPASSHQACHAPNSGRQAAGKSCCQRGEGREGKANLPFLERQRGRAAGIRQKGDGHEKRCKEGTFKKTWGRRRRFRNDKQGEEGGRS